MVDRINLETIAPPRRWTHSVRTSSGPLVFLSGMVRGRFDGSVPDGRESHAEQAHANEPPASTLVGVQSLGPAEYLIEVELIASLE